MQKIREVLRRGHSTRYFRMGWLLGDLAMARADGSYARLQGCFVQCKGGAFWCGSTIVLVDMPRLLAA